MICNPPPFPGAATAGETPALLLFKVTPFRVVVVLATASIPPPARLALFPVIVEPDTVTVAPTSDKIPPPEPAVPFAILLLITALF